jgi:hypothetical protein
MQGIGSLFYFNKFDYTSPLQTAIWFVAFVIFMDLFIISFQRGAVGKV